MKTFALDCSWQEDRIRHRTGAAVVVIRSLHLWQGPTTRDLGIRTWCALVIRRCWTPSCPHRKAARRQLRGWLLAGFVPAPKLPSSTAILNSLRGVESASPAPARVTYPSTAPGSMLTQDSTPAMRFRAAAAPKAATPANPTPEWRARVIYGILARRRLRSHRNRCGLRRIGRQRSHVRSQTGLETFDYDEIRNISARKKRLGRDGPSDQATVASEHGGQTGQTSADPQDHKGRIVKD